MTYMKKIMRALAVVLIGGLALFLYNYIGTHNMGLLNPKGAIAVAEKHLLITAVCLMMIVIIPVFIMLFSFAWKYRAGNTKAKYTPDWHTNIALEITWWAIPIVIVTILGVLTWKSSHDLDPFKPLDVNVKPVIVEVVALDWKWLFIYPEEHIATVNFLELPKDTPINFQITSDAPMNAFWIPQLGSQVYAMAGMNAKLHLIANEEGVYKGVSSNFSGDGFSGMKFDTKVVSGEEYATWVNTVRTSPEALTEEEYTELTKQTKNNPVKYFSSVKDGLYESIIMKFMVPPNSDMDMGYEDASQTMSQEEIGHTNSH
jgi:cytochrome o ubiquinol oxidase subunit 2